MGSSCVRIEKFMGDLINTLAREYNNSALRFLFIGDAQGPCWVTVVDTPAGANVLEFIRSHLPANVTASAVSDDQEILQTEISRLLTTPTGGSIQLLKIELCAP